MIVAPLPVNEAERLQSLRHVYEILDTEPEAGFDRVTRLCAWIFRVPIALVSLVDESRQWFKSCHGLSVRETGRDVAFCAHAILDSQVLVVEDAKLDERFCDNPLVTGPPFLRFYAGAPLRTRDGFNLGTLCVASPEPRSFSSEESSALTELAAVVMDQLELHRTTRLVTALHTDVLAMAYAKSRVLSQMSCDIRTPLSVISGATEMMDSLEPTSEQKEWLDVVRHRAQHLTEVIDEHLRSAEAAATLVLGEDVPFDLLATIEEVLRPFEDLANGGGITLKSDLHASFAPWTGSKGKRSSSAKALASGSRS